MTQEGTNTYALNSNGTGTINYDIANDLNILASKDTYSMTSETETKNASGSVGNNVIQLNYDQSDANSKVRSTIYNNVDIIVNNINIKTGNNIDIKGANVLTQTTTDSQWVNEQTSIIDNNSVNIKVGTKENSKGNTNIVGAVIASGSYNNESEKFKDNGNLNLATNTLTYQDLNDFFH